MKNATLNAALAVAALWGGAWHDAAAQSFDARDRVVRVRVAGVDMNGADCFEFGSGAYVSPDGDVLTSQHLIRRWLQQSCDPESLRVEVAEGRDGPWLAAEEIMSNERFDYMVLRVYVDGRTKQYFQRAANPRHDVTKLETPIYTSGFPGNDGYRSFRGLVTDFQGPPTPLNMLWMWRAALSSGDGQSGSPIYLANGQLIGIYRGDDAVREDEVYIVPIQHIAYPLEMPQTTLSLGRVVITQRFSSEFSVETTRAAANSSCEPGRRLRWDFAAPEGWVIDPSSFVVTQRARGGNSRVIGTDLAGQDAPTNVAVDVRVANGVGFCALGFRGDPGLLDVDVSYDVSRTENVQALEYRAVPGSLLVVGGTDSPVQSIDLVDPNGVRHTYSREQLLSGGPLRLEIVDGRELLRIN